MLNEALNDNDWKIKIIDGLLDYNESVTMVGLKKRKLSFSCLICE